MKDLQDYNIETLAIHAGQEPDPLTGAVVPPIYQTSTFAQDQVGQLKAGYDYSRADNPTRKNLETCIAALEGGQYGFAFGSGMAAINNVMYLLQTGDHILVGDDVYGGTYRYFTKVLNQFGITTTFVDTSNLDAVRQAIQENTKLLWVESPTNPLLKLSDIKALVSLAKERDMIVTVDNTFMTPYFQNPLKLGADIVVHSATKYLGGHSDVIGGLMATNNKDIAEKMHFTLKSVGAIPGPFDCWLTQRGIKTLAVRMEAHQKNAMAIANMLEAHDQVDRVYYPGLSSHPQHQLAKEQMQGFGGMISFVVKGGLEAAKAILENTQVFTLAESLGGVESLIEHPAIMTHASIPKEHRDVLGIDDGLVRLSVGIENQSDLIDDLKQALSKAALVAH